MEQSTETQTTELDTKNTVETQETAAEETSVEASVDTEKVVEKLQKRIGKEQSEKNDVKNQLEQALERINELENSGKKSIQEKTAEEKAAEIQKAKDEEIHLLKRQIKVAEITQQADEVLKDAGLSVGKDVLSLVVDEDEDKTLANVKNIINWLNEERQKWSMERNTGYTPKQKNNNATNFTKEEFDKMTFAEKVELQTKNPILFNEITGGK